MGRLAHRQRGTVPQRGAGTSPHTPARGRDANDDAADRHDRDVDAGEPLARHDARLALPGRSSEPRVSRRFEPEFDGIPADAVNFYESTPYSPAQGTQALHQPCRVPRW